MGSLFTDLQALADKVLLAEFAHYRRASYHTKPIKTLLENLLRSFVDRGPLTELFRLAVLMDVNLQDRGYQEINFRLHEMLQESMCVACKDLDGFVVIVQTFIRPVLAAGSTNHVQ
jgi:hypothetical protein